MDETIENSPRNAAIARSMRKQVIQQYCHIVDEWLQTPGLVKKQAVYTDLGHEGSLAYNINYLGQYAYREKDSTKRNDMTTKIMHETTLLARSIAFKVPKYASAVPNYEPPIPVEAEFDAEAVEKLLDQPMTSQEVLEAWKKAEAVAKAQKKSLKRKAQQDNPRNYRLQNFVGSGVMFFEDNEYSDESDSSVSSDGYCSSHDLEEHDTNGDMGGFSAVTVAENHLGYVDGGVEKGAGAGAGASVQSQIGVSMEVDPKDTIVGGIDPIVEELQTERMRLALTATDEVEQIFTPTTETKLPETATTQPLKRKHSPAKGQKISKRERKMRIERATAEMERLLAEVAREKELLAGHNDDDDEDDDDHEQPDRSTS